jgi:pyruvate kinase
MKLINKFKQAKRLRPHKTIGMMLEARGREIRLTEVNDKSGIIELKSGAVMTLNCINPFGTSTQKTLYCNSDIILRFLKPNDVVYLDDGKVVCIVLEISNDGCTLEVKVGGPLKSNSQIRFTQGKHSGLQILNDQDIKDLQLISQHI